MENVATPTRTRKSTNRITDAIARMSANIAERRAPILRPTGFGCAIIPNEWG
jgi:hypothetical protein